MFRTYNDVTIPQKKEEEDETVTKLYTCDFCSEGWSSETEVELHRTKCHKAIIASYMRGDFANVCKMCMTQFESADAMLRHIKSDHLLSSETAIRVERDIYICNVCSEVYFNRNLLIHHLFYTHYRKKHDQMIKCPTCFKTIRLVASWYHFRTHGLQSIAACKICCRKFKDRQRLGLHLMTHPFQYNCGICGYNTNKGHLFNCHIQTAHKMKMEGVSVTKIDCTPYFAPRVPTNVWNASALMGWRGVRLADQVSICIMCREICTDTESMERHIALDHSMQEKSSTDHKCFCGEQFSSKVLLKHHTFKEH